MRQACVLALTGFAFALCVSGQDEVPTLKTEVKSAFVWGEDSPTGAVSSTIQDPLTGNTIAKLSYGGIEVSARMGFEGVGKGKAGTFLSYTATIANGTDAKVSVRYGGISVDGHPASPLRVVPPDKKLSKKEQHVKPDVVELGGMHCFTSGFLSGDHFFSDNFTSQVLTVAPGSVVTVSSVIRDRRSYSPRCSVMGCYPTGTIRYYLRVNSQDYVFVWPGSSAVYCGK